jgi:hypothetical protein
MPSKTSPEPIIPPAEVVRGQLLDVCRRARLLRRLLQLAREAELHLTTGSALPAPTRRKGVAGA